MSTYDYDELRAAIRTVRESMNQNERYDAADMLADYTEVSLDLADEVKGSR